MQEIRDAVKQWFLTNKRSLPWRETHDPYLIWLSEVILQQTRIDQGLPYYRRFVERFPDVFTLAEADEAEVLNMWQGLGYYNRAVNLHHTAKVIAREYNGNFPATFDELKQLKGIGDYTASAISSMAFGEPRAVVDGNVNRVLSRIFGIKAPVNTTKGKQLMKEIAGELLDERDPGVFNEAIMDFGAIQCTAANPKCAICPVREHCQAFHDNLVNELPVKEKKLKRRTRYFYYVVPFNEEGIVLRQRGSDDIWRKMYDFPLLESKKNEPPDLSKLATKIGGDKASLTFRGEYKHVLTHQDIIARFYQTQHFDLNKIMENFIFVRWKAFEEYALPRLIDRFCTDNLNLHNNLLNQK